MAIHHQEPNWSLITDHLQEPTTFTELYELLTPRCSTGNEKQRALAAWKMKEFYKKENLLPFLYYASTKIKTLPRFHKDEMPTILRVVRLYQEIGLYESAYKLMEEHNLIQFAFTSLHYEEWDPLTYAVSLNYLIVKRKVYGLEKQDHKIYEKVKFNQDWAVHYAPLLSQKELLEFYFWYIRYHAKYMSIRELEENMMEMAMYCNTYIIDIYTYDLSETYYKWIELFARCPIDYAVISAHRAVLAHLGQLADLPCAEKLDDYLYEIKELLENMHFPFLVQYESFIGKLVSYIPFYEAVKVPQQTFYFEKILYACKGIEYKEAVLRNYLFSQIPQNFSSFIRPFLRNERFQSIHEILFYWLSEQQRLDLESTYDLSKIYERYALG
jgi:hypothetical protein